MNKTYIIAGVALAIAAALIAVFATRDASQSVASVRVTASFYPLYFLASEIGGEKALVSNITPAGAEPHDFEPTAADWVRMAESTLLFVNGGDIDVWSKKIGTQIQKGGTKVVDVSTALMTLESSENHHEDESHEETHEEGHADEEGHPHEHELDPHVWLSPRNMQRMAQNVLNSYKEIDSENAAYYEARANELAEKLGELDSEIRSSLAQCTRKEFITSHAAFGYLAQEYGLTQVAIAGITPDEEPSAQDLALIVAFVTQEKIPVIFFETLVSPKLSETIARETGAQTLVLNPIEGLTDEEISSGKNYLTEMRSNLQNLKIALGCK